MVAQEDMIKKHTTGNMSANATGSFGLNSKLAYARVPVANTRSGNITLSNYQTSWVSSDDNIGFYAKTVNINVQHTHTYGTDDDIETRPKNYTIRIWKRIS